MWEKIVELLKSLFSPQPEPREPSVDAGAVTSSEIQTEPEKTTETKPIKELPRLYVSKYPNKGASPADVMILQRRLKEMGFDPGPADGIYGTKTLTAVQNFQKSLRFPASGSIGEKTLAALKLSLKAPTKNSEKGNLPSTGVQGRGRSIEKELELIIDAKLLSIAPLEIRQAVTDKDGNKIVWLANVALEALKIREKTDNNDGQLVELLQKTIGVAENEPWCMAQQQSCIAYAETKLGVVSKVVASESVMSTFHDSPEECQVQKQELKPGDIICWQHGRSWKGHAGCFGGWVVNLKKMHVIEGNTTAGEADGEIVREGGGTYKTQRSLGVIGTMSIEGFLRPF